MSVVYLPVEPQLGMTSAERAVALNMEVFRLMLPVSVRNPNDIMLYQYTDYKNENSEQHALVADTTDVIYISPEVDLTELLALLPEVPQTEKDLLVTYIEINKGDYVPFENLVPSTSVQLTEAEAVAAGWPPVTPEE